MATLEENINQAIADFDDIEAAIEEKGVEVADGTDTSEYGNLIRSIPVGSDVIVDQTYDPESENAQSGTAVAEAIKNSHIKYVESTSDNILDLFSMESGTYILKGSFRPYPNATKYLTFSKLQLVSVSKGSLSTCVQVFYPPYNAIQYLNIWADDTLEAGYDYERKDAKLYYMEDTRNMTNTVDENSDDTHYPSAKAVYDAMELKRIESLDTENMKYMRDIESGYYIMHGYFQPFPNSKSTVIMDTLCVSVARVDEGSHLMSFSPLNFKIRCYEILVDDTAEDGFVFNSWVINLLELNELIEKVEQRSTKQETANALKATASGEVVRVDDVSPVEHNAKAKVSSKNLFNAYNCTLSRLNKADNGTFISSVENYYYSTIYVPNSIVKEYFYCGNTLTFSAPETPDEGKVSIVVSGTRANGATYQEVTSEVGKKTITITVADDFTNITKVELRVNRRSSPFTDTETVYTQFQLEEGDTATEYEPYIDPASVTLYRCGKNLFNASDFSAAIANVETDERNGKKYTVKGNVGNSVMAYSAGAARFVLRQGVKIPDKITVSLYVTLLEQGSYDNRLRLWSLNKNKETAQQLDFPLTLNVRQKITAVYDTKTGFFSGVTFYLNNNKLLLELDTMQVEIGDTATEYAEYDGSNCVPNADGTAEILSASPTMTLFTDTEGANIEIEYNQDTNTAMDNVKKDIRELDRVMSEMSNESSNVLTDTATGKKYKLYVENGKLSMEVIE